LLVPLLLVAVGWVRMLELLRVLRVRMLDGVRIDPGSSPISLPTLPVAKPEAQSVRDPP
jgi:hypothetical protein